MNQVTPPWGPHSEIPDYMIASAGRQFRETADFLHARLHPSGQLNCVTPLLMVAGFGIELFLKSLNAQLVYNQDEFLKDLGGYQVTTRALKSGHRLVALYDAIDSDHRAALDAYYRQNPPRVGAPPTVR